jgi:hypothetical protein
MMDLQAAADMLGPGAVEVPIFEREIIDVVRRSSVALQRTEQKPATGHPHRYFEQTDIAQAQAVDPRALSANPSSPVRVERSAYVKACTAQSNLSLFDRDVTEQQGQFASVVAKDLNDIISAVERKRGKMYWRGADTSMLEPQNLEWCGALNQIPQQFVISPAQSIIDGIKLMVARMVANETYEVLPSAIYMNPIASEAVSVEAKAAKIELQEMEVVAGVKVGSLMTQAGRLPLVPDPWLTSDTGAAFGFSAPPAGYSNFYVAILMESLVEIGVISGKEYNPNPRLFQLGLTGNLAGQFVAVKFDTLVFKGASYAHAVGVIQLPTPA